MASETYMIMVACPHPQTARVDPPSTTDRTVARYSQLKNEMYYRQSFPDRARARFAVADYIEVPCNRQRLTPTLGYRTPFEALTDYQAAATAA